MSSAIHFRCDVLRWLVRFLYLFLTRQLERIKSLNRKLWSFFFCRRTTKTKRLSDLKLDKMNSKRLVAHFEMHNLLHRFLVQGSIQHPIQFDLIIFHFNPTLNSDIHAMSVAIYWISRVYVTFTQAPIFYKGANTKPQWHSVSDIWNVIRYRRANMRMIAQTTYYSLDKLAFSTSVEVVSKPDARLYSQFIYILLAHKFTLPTKMCKRVHMVVWIGTRQPTDRLH